MLGVSKQCPLQSKKSPPTIFNAFSFSGKYPNVFLLLQKIFRRYLQASMLWQHLVSVLLIKKNQKNQTTPHLVWV